MPKTYTKTILSNGMTVMLKEIHTTPLISLWVWYRVGSRDEAPPLTGISHLVEHMQFKGTRKFPSEVMDRAVAREGTLILSQGAPMLLAGDELGRSQQGNNNAYCQDNELNWLDWTPSRDKEGLVDFVGSALFWRQRFSSAVVGISFAEAEEQESFHFFFFLSFWGYCSISARSFNGSPF